VDLDHLYKIEKGIAYFKVEGNIDDLDRDGTEKKNEDPTREMDGYNEEDTCHSFVDTTPDLNQLSKEASEHEDPYESELDDIKMG